MSPDQKTGLLGSIATGPAAYFLRFKKVAILFGIILVMWGILSTLLIPKESAPYIEYGIVSISTVYTGASAVDIDSLITSEIEDRIKDIRGLNKYSSVSRNSVSSITLEMEPGQNMTRVMGDVRSKVDQAKPALPAEIDDDPVITEIDSSIEPFVSIVLSGPYTQAQLTDFAEELKTALEDVPSVAQVSLSGNIEREIAVRIDQQRLEALGLSLSNVTSAIRNAHRDTPIGDFEIDDFEYSIRFVGKFESVEDVRAVVLADLSSEDFPSLITVGDIAEVSERDDKDNKSIYRFVHVREGNATAKSLPQYFGDILDGVLHLRFGSILHLALLIVFFVGVIVPVISFSGVALPRAASLWFFILLFVFTYIAFDPDPSVEAVNSDPTSAVELVLSKKSGSDILKVDADVRVAAADFAAAELPDQLRIDYINEAAVAMRESYSDVVISGLQSFLIVMVFIFLFVGVMEGLVASIVIPITFLVTIAVLFQLDKTLNFMTNFSMILSLGILVDTAIVIVVGANQFIKQGYSPTEAPLKALQEFWGPLVAGTLTTLAVFIPLLSMPGILGQYLSFIPITVIIILIVSLFVSLFLLPAYTALLLPDLRKPKPPHQRFARLRAFGGAIRQSLDRRIDQVIGVYERWLTRLVARRIRRLGIFGITIALFFLSFAIPIPFVLFPSGDAPFVTVEVEMPEGTISEKTLAPAVLLEDIIMQDPEVRYVRTNVNGKTANLFVELLPIAEREILGLRTSNELEQDLAPKLTLLADRFGGSIRVRSAQGGPPSEAPVALRVIAKDRNAIDDAERVATELTDLVRTIPNTVGVQNNLEQIPGEFRFRVDRDRATALGVNPDIVPGLVRTALQGSTAATITRNGRDVDVVVELAQGDSRSLEDIRNMKIFAPDGRAILLEQIVTIDRQDALAAIRRQDGDIAFTVSSLLGPEGNAGIITQAALDKISEGAIDVPETVSIVTAGENEENAALIQTLVVGLVIAIFLMFFILVIQFNAYAQPVLILFTLLFAQIGVTLGLALTGTPRSLAYLLGIIALAGIAVNNAIIMIDQINLNRRALKEQGETEGILSKAVVAAGTSRFVPVVLTTLTTSAGILPLVFQDVFWAGLSFTVMFGLLTASIMTLFITPALYIQLEREKLITVAFLLFATIAAIGIFLLVKLSPIGFVLLLVSVPFYFLYRWLCRRRDRRTI